MLDYFDFVSILYSIIKCFFMSEDHVIISKPVREIADPLLDLVEKTYTSSFPEEERRDFSLVRKLWRKIAVSRCMPCYGMVFMWVSLRDGNLRALFMRSIRDRRVRS